MSIDQEKLHELLDKAITDFGATYHAALLGIGDKLGLYKALAKWGPLTPAELAEKTSTAERYVREWLSFQAAGGYGTYSPESKKFHLSEEQTFVLADDTSPVFVPGVFQVAVSSVKSYPEIKERFRSGYGFGWHEHDHGMFEGNERFFRPSYAHNQVSRWIPALYGTEAKLREEALVSDVGCGHSASTILMAKTYTKSTFIDYDYHGPSIERARKAVAQAGASGNTSFEVSASKEYPGTDYDFVTSFDCLHDMGDHAGASAHVLRSLSGEGTWMIVEPFANDNLEDNLNPRRQGILRSVHAYMHPGITRSGSRHGTRHTGGRSEAERGRDEGRFH
jgi:SAM-dependent methyltransferase